jgi:regulator of sigma E protease
MALGSIALAALGIGLLIFLHELGHFMAARLAGVRVEVFSLGFGPRLFGWHWRGTDFRLSLVPLGGFVMVAGQDPNDHRYPPEESLHSKSAGQRALFWSGGVLMNALFALIVFPLVFRAGVSFESPVLGAVERGSAAWEAGLRPGERVVEVAGKPVRSFQTMAIEVALHGGRPLELRVEAPDGTSRVVTTTPHFHGDSGLYGLGAQPAWIDAEPPIEVRADSAAARAGLRTGDLLVRINGQRPATHEPLAATTEQVSVVVRRGDEVVDATIRVSPDGPLGPPRIGVGSLPRRIEGIRTSSTLAAALGLRRGDVVLGIDGRAFLSGSFASWAEGDGTTTWSLWRDGRVIEATAAAPRAERQRLHEEVVLSHDRNLLLQPVEYGTAFAAGMRAGDWLVAIDGREVDAWDDLLEAVEAAPPQLRLRLVRPDPNRVPTSLERWQGETIELVVAPERRPQPDLGMSWELQPHMTEVRAESFGEALALGTTCSLDLVKQLYVTLKRLLTGEVGAKNLGGIVRISQVSYQAAQRGPSWFWYFLALLSINLAFVNLLPVPVLDGGHLLFLLIEKVKGSPVNTRVLGYSQIICLVLVLLLVLFVTYNDILRLK